MTTPTQPSIAVIGCGYWGKNLIRNLAELQCLEAICDVTPQGRETAKLLAPNAAITSSLNEVLQSDVAGVVIATPAETHFDVARQALEAGKDVFVEKPLALQYDQGTALVRLAERMGRILMVGHVLEYHPAIVRLYELTHSGELGKVEYIYSNRLSLGKVRREENILWSFAPHDIAVIIRLLGAMPFQVVACGGAYVQPNVADVTVTSMLFDNGVRAFIHVSWLHPYKEQRLIVVGRRRMATFDDVSKKLMLYDQRVEIHDGSPVPVKGIGEEIPFAVDEPLRRECEAFLSAIATRIPPLTDAHSGLQVLSILQAAQRSLILNGEPAPVMSLPERVPLAGGTL